MQNLINRIATPQACRHWEGAGWRLSNEKKGFGGFVGFVTKTNPIWNIGKTEPAF